MKRKTAKEILAESFREVAGKKSIDKITIRDIVENCGYSPATFYRQFKDKYDLIAWDYTRRLEEILSQVGGNEQSWKKTLSDAAIYFEEQKEYLSNLFLHTTGLDSFIAYMREINYSVLKRTILLLSDAEALDEKTEMLIRTYVMGTVQITCEWILGKYNVDAGTLAGVYEEVLPTPLHQYLLK